MRIVDKGTGTPVVVVPGIQGRWEWMQPGIDALAARCRVVTFSLCDEPSCQAAFDAETGFSCYVEQVREAMDQAGLDRAVIAGVSYGGLIAAAFAARYPERAVSLVLMSALPPSWAPDSRVRFYLRAPRLLTPVFMLASLRMYREIADAHPGLRASLREVTRHGSNILTHMFSPTRMARRVRLLAKADVEGVRALRLPALVITGEPRLDRVVPVSATHEYAQWLPQAQVTMVEHTGHLGFITRPEVVADLVSDFAATADRRESRRRIG